jgi:hypothetical protein
MTDQKGNNPRTVARLLRAIANGHDAKVSKQAAVFNAAADILEAGEPKVTTKATPFTVDNVALIAGPQTPVARFADYHWQIWLAYNTTYTAGTFVQLMPDGRALSTSISADGTVSTGVIKGRSSL